MLGTIFIIGSWECLLLEGRDCKVAVVLCCPVASGLLRACEEREMSLNLGMHSHCPSVIYSVISLGILL